jgi:hypothetical protein
MPPVQLTRDEWTEIYYALQTKLERLLEGEYLDPDIPAERQRQHHLAWAAQLSRLLETIGPDGRAAASRGVAPVPSERCVPVPWLSRVDLRLLAHPAQQRQQGDPACS